jgi:hypothetical protein
VDNGEQIMVECLVDAKPEHFEVEWLFNETQVISSNQSILQIRPIGNGSYGKYTCLARNSISAQNTSFYLAQNSEFAKVQ